jgi:hypothetical protein
MSSFVQPTYLNNSTTASVVFNYFISGTEKCLKQDCTSLAANSSFLRSSSGNTDQWGIWIPIVYSQSELNSNYVVIVQDDYASYLWLQPNDDSVITLVQSGTLTFNGGTTVTTVPPPSPVVEITLDRVGIAGLSVRSQTGGGIIIIGVLDSTENPTSRS